MLVTHAGRSRLSSGGSAAPLTLPLGTHRKAFHKVERTLGKRLRAGANPGRVGMGYLVCAGVHVPLLGNVSVSGLQKEKKF